MGDAAVEDEDDGNW